MPLLERAGIEIDEGVLEIANAKDMAKLIDAAAHGRIWDRELTLRDPG